MIETGAYSLLRNLYTSFTGNATTRHVYPDAVGLMADLSCEGLNPVYYVSSSPWNLHAFLADVFHNSGLTRGPIFLRDLGLSKTKFITDGHGNHKGASIDLILNANPDLPAILLGDTGQHDARIYREVIARHGDRIIAVGLRIPGAGLDAADRADHAAIANAVVHHYAERDFSGLSGELRLLRPDLFQE
jgi:phosphatidate phosphatase APP1